MSARGWQRWVWLIIGSLAALAAGWALLDPSLYDGLITPELRPGVVGQDVVSLLAGLALCAAAGRRTPRPAAEIAGLGLVSYFAYAYGIFAIERMYNPLYLVYLAIFALASWSAVLGAFALVGRYARGASMSAGSRRLCAVGAVLQPLIFYPLWITMLVPLLRQREQIDALYSIFVIDPCFVMPAFLLIAVGLLRDRHWSLVLAPAIFVLGAVLIGSLALAELLKPAYGIDLTAPGLAPPLLLSATFVLLTVLALRALRWGCRTPIEPTPILAGSTVVRWSLRGAAPGPGCVPSDGRLPTGAARRPGRGPSGV
jgi:hypothetical protein